MIPTTDAAVLAGGARIIPQSVFATTLYTGNGAPSRIITNGLNLSGAGGMVWIKHRQKLYSHDIFDTVREPVSGDPPFLHTDTAAQELDSFLETVRFRSDGFSVGQGEGVNENGQPFASWGFKRAKRFFDVVIWTGDGQASRQIAHGLGGAVGMILIKRRDQADDWSVWHRSVSGRLVLNSAAPRNATAHVTATDPSSFTVTAAVNVAGAKYVAYVFAQNLALIDCGSYAGTAGVGQVVKCGYGWRPQFVLIKNTTSNDTDWVLLDRERDGNPVNNSLSPNRNSAETNTAGGAGFEANGFSPRDGNVQVNGAGQSYAYLALRSPT